MGPSPELIAAIVETEKLNPSWGCRRNAQQLCLVFGLEIDKDVIRRVLAITIVPILTRMGLPG